MVQFKLSSVIFILVAAAVAPAVALPVRAKREPDSQFVKPQHGDGPFSLVPPPESTPSNSKQSDFVRRQVVEPPRQYNPPSHEVAQYLARPPSQSTPSQPTPSQFKSTGTQQGGGYNHPKLGDLLSKNSPSAVRDQSTHKDDILILPPMPTPRSGAGQFNSTGTQQGGGYNHPKLGDLLSRNSPSAVRNHSTHKDNILILPRMPTPRSGATQDGLSSPANRTSPPGQDPSKSTSSTGQSPGTKSPLPPSTGKRDGRQYAPKRSSPLRQGTLASGSTPSTDQSQGSQSLGKQDGLSSPPSTPASKPAQSTGEPKPLKSIFRPQPNVQSQ